MIDAYTNLISATPTVCHTSVEGIQKVFVQCLDKHAPHLYVVDVKIADVGIKLKFKVASLNVQKIWHLTFITPLTPP